MASTNADGRVSYTEHELKDPELRNRLETEARLAAEREREREAPLRLQVGRESEPWRVEVGGNYSQSYKSGETSNDNSSANPQEPAQTTESHSPQHPVVADSTAPSTAGSGRTTVSQQSDKPMATQRRPPKTTPAKTAKTAMPEKKQARATMLPDDDFGDF